MSEERLHKKIAQIREYLSLLEDQKKNCRKRMKSDKVYRGSILYYLYIMADSCISLAEMVIKIKELPNPQSYHEAIDILGSNHIIPDEFAYDFAKIAGFRNFLAHDYEKTDYDEICKYLIERLDDVRAYLSYIEAHF